MRDAFTEFAVGFFGPRSVTGDASSPDRDGGDAAVAGGRDVIRTNGAIKHPMCDPATRPTPPLTRMQRAARIVREANQQTRRDGTALNADGMVA